MGGVMDGVPVAGCLGDQMAAVLGGWGGGWGGGWEHALGWVFGSCTACSPPAALGVVGWWGDGGARGQVGDQTAAVLGERR